jgi:replicative superfamily II helicase
MLFCILSANQSRFQIFDSHQGWTERRAQTSWSLDVIKKKYFVGLAKVSNIYPRTDLVHDPAIIGNIIAALNTGSGKTFISLLLIKWIAAQKAHKDKVIIFLVPRVALVQQQGDYITKHTSLQVIKLYGALALDFSDRETWRKRFKEHDVLVMTG